MATSIILIVFFAVAAVLILVILAALTWALLDERSENSHAEADKIRDQARENHFKLTSERHSPTRPSPTTTPPRPKRGHSGSRLADTPLARFS